MALDILSTPATSSNVERLFSFSKLVDIINRQKMLPTTKRMLILSKNFWLYQLKVKKSKFYLGYIKLYTFNTINISI